MKNEEMQSNHFFPKSKIRIFLFFLISYILYLTSIIFADGLDALVKEVPAAAEYVKPVLESVN